MNLDTDHAQQYASVRSDKQRECFTKELCFNCDYKEHLHKNCSINLYSKIWQMITINLSENVLNIFMKEIYILLINKEVKLSNTHVFLLTENK